MRYINFKHASIPMVLLIGIMIVIMMGKANMAEEKQKDFDRAEELKKIEAAINNVMGWAINKDFDLFYRSIADDSDFISVTPYKRVKFGIDEVKKDSSFWGSPDFKAIRHELHDLRIKFSQMGEVAWFYCILDDINEWKGQPANWEKVRWTGVLEKRDGMWRVVMQHFSFPKES
jgi:ketosteroid isomerase-like protein